MGKHVYVFDMDDTLYLERDYVRSGFVHIGNLARDIYGVDEVGVRAWSLFEEGTRGNTFDLLVSEFSLPKKAIQFFIMEYRNHQPSISLTDDARQFIAQLPGDAIGSGLITDGDSVAQWRKIRALGLDKIFENIIVTGDRGLDWTKPSDKAFKLIESYFPADGVEFTYFGDNPKKDFQSPRRRGWGTVRIRRPLGLHYDHPNTVDLDKVYSQFPPPNSTEPNAKVQGFFANEGQK